MHSKDRQKMCSNCDGRIPIESEECPYCAASQLIASSAVDHHKSLQDSLTALYTPPYAARPKTEPVKENMQEKRFQQTSASLGIPTIPFEAKETEQVQDEKSGFWPVLYLSLASNLLVIGLLQLFFSDNGFLRLEWDSSYWFVYCLSALPLLFLGYKKASSLQ